MGQEERSDEDLIRFLDSFCAEDPYTYEQMDLYAEVYDGYEEPIALIDASEDKSTVQVYVNVKAGMRRTSDLIKEITLCNGDFAEYDEFFIHPHVGYYVYGEDARMEYASYVIPPQEESFDYSTDVLYVSDEPIPAYGYDVLGRNNDRYLRNLFEDDE